MVTSLPPLSSDPVVHAAWHPVALSSQLIPGQLHAIELLGESLVLWRGPAGLHAWQDLCIHRGVKLSLGQIVNDGCALRCAYHGWTYAEDGHCLRIPAHPSIKPPARAQVKTYTCAEHSGLVWVSLRAPQRPPIPCPLSPKAVTPPSAPSPAAPTPRPPEPRA